MNPNKPLPPKSLSLEDVIALKGEEWRKTLDFARTTLPVKSLSDRNLVRLTKGAATREQTELMVQLLFRDMKERPVGVPGIDLFFKVVDHSNFSLGEWLTTVTFFIEALQIENRITPFPKMLGYLQCCEDSPENKNIEHHFIDLVDDMLKTHGYLG